MKQASKRNTVIVALTFAVGCLIASCANKAEELPPTRGTSQWYMSQWEKASTPEEKKNLYGQLLVEYLTVQEYLELEQLKDD